MEETNFWINNIKTYFDTLYELNINYIRLIGTGHMKLENEVLFEKIGYGISKLIPMSANDKEKKVVIKAKDESDGIIDLLGKDYKFVKSDLKKIVEESNEALYNLKALRNRLEHCPHRKMGSSGISVDENFDITFGYLKKSKKFPLKDYKDIELDNYRCNSNEIKLIIMNLNTLFSKIQNELDLELQKYDDEYRNNQYFEDCLDINYEEFNHLYNRKDFFSICKLVNKELMK